MVAVPVNVTDPAVRAPEMEAEPVDTVPDTVNDPPVNRFPAILDPPLTWSAPV
jgi:hypothetical protein